MARSDLKRFPELTGMRQARDAAKAEQRKPTEDDRPPLKTFPLTKAARAALDLRKTS